MKDALLFYTHYLKEYHKVKAIYLKWLLSNVQNVNEELEKFTIHDKIDTRTSLIIRVDIRLNYFQSIETFFEFFFALLPVKNKIPDNEDIIKLVSNSNWRRNYKLISDIAENKFDISYELQKKIKILGYEVSIGHYLFYWGIFETKNFPVEVFNSIDTSVSAIANGIKQLAMDFKDRGEYNALKHAVRAFPSISEIQIREASSLKLLKKWETPESITYYQFNDDRDKVEISLSVLDSERDFLMTLFSTNLLHNMLYFRKIAFERRENKKPNSTKIAIFFFDEENIKDCYKRNVDIGGFTFKSEKTKK